MAVTGRELLAAALHSSKNLGHKLAHMGLERCDRECSDEAVAVAVSSEEGAELIRRADAEPVLRAALSPESLHKALVAAVRSRYGLTDREIAERMSAALLTTPDAPG